MQLRVSGTGQFLALLGVIFTLVGPDEASAQGQIRVYEMTRSNQTLGQLQSAGLQAPQIISSAAISSYTQDRETRFLVSLDVRSGSGTRVESGCVIQLNSLAEAQALASLAVERSTAISCVSLRSFIEHSPRGLAVPGFRGVPLSQVSLVTRVTSPAP